VSASRHWPLPQALKCRPGPHYPSIYYKNPLRSCHRLCCTKEPTSGPRTTSHNERGCIYVRAHTARDNTMQCNAIPRFIATTKASDSLPRTTRHVTRIARCSSRTNLLTRVFMFQKSSAHSCDYVLVGTGPLFYVSTLNSLQPSGYYMYHQFNIQQFHVQPTQWYCVFCVYLKTNSDYFPIRH